MTPKKSHSLMQIQVEEIHELSLAELCSIYHIDENFIQDLIAEGIVEPRGFSVETWRFDTEHFRIIRTAMRLSHDLEINMAGIALVIDLMRQMELLQKQLQSVEKFFKAPSY